MDKKQTAVGLLEEKLKISFGNDMKPLRGFFVIAKEMEKEQIKNAYYNGTTDEIRTKEELLFEAEHFYNETYGGNQ
jgi:hypothetical protein